MADTDGKFFNSEGGQYKDSQFSQAKVTKGLVVGSHKNRLVSKTSSQVLVPMREQSKIQKHNKGHTRKHTGTRRLEH